MRAVTPLTRIAPDDAARRRGNPTLCPKNLAECANGRLPTNRPSLELSPYRPKAIEPEGERGTDPVSSSTRTVAWALSPNRAPVYSAQLLSPQAGRGEQNICADSTQSHPRSRGLLASD